MKRKRALIRGINRVLYASGFVFLIVGLLLSALSTSVLASGVQPLGLAQDATQTLSVESAAAGTATAAAGATQTAVCLICKTVTPSVANPTATNTPVPGQPSNTPAPTHAPMTLNLSNICGYPSDSQTQWKVANSGSSDLDYVWRVDGSDVSGSGTVRAHSDDYFSTAFGVTVHLYVGDQLVDTESCLAPCKQDLQLAYTCNGDGLTWRATNANGFGVDYTVRVDGQQTGRGVIPANSTVDVATSASGAHSVELTWTDTRPGTHTVRLNSPPNSCQVVQTVTPTFTATVPVEVTSTFTPTPTITNTVPVEVTSTFTPTPTVTNTVPVVITSTFTFTPTATVPVATATFTNTPTVTQTSQPNVIPSNTPTATVPVATATFTNTPTVTQTSLPNVIPSNTPTATITNTPDPTQTFTPTPTFTSTPTPTRTLTALAGFVASATVTSTVTPIGTLAAPASTITSTPVLIPVTGVDLTRPIAANSLSIFGSLLTNFGLFALGLALALTGISSQMKD